jgi:hypothetical protein
MDSRKRDFKFKFKQIHDQELQKIGQNLIRSEQPQVKKVVKKLIDYAGDVEKSKSLDLEIKRLERFLQEKKILEGLEKEKQKELRDALSTLKDILKEDMEILEMYLDIEKNETIELLCVIGVII